MRGFTQATMAGTTLRIKKRGRWGSKKMHCDYDLNAKEYVNGNRQGHQDRARNGDHQARWGGYPGEESPASSVNTKRFVGRLAAHALICAYSFVNRKLQIVLLTK